MLLKKELLHALAVCHWLIGRPDVLCSAHVAQVCWTVDIADIMFVASLLRLDHAAEDQMHLSNPYDKHYHKDINKPAKALKHLCLRLRPRD